MKEAAERNAFGGLVELWCGYARALTKGRAVVRHMNSLRLLSYHFKLNLFNHFLVEFDSGSVSADLFHRFLQVDDLAVYIVAKFLESLRNLKSVDRTKHSACCACFPRLPQEPGSFPR